MNITVTGRGIEVTAAMRSYVEEKLQAATNVLDMPMEAETVLRVEHNPSNPVPQVVEVTVRVKGAVVRVSEAAVDMYAAIDLAADRVSRQLRKYKTRVALLLRLPARLTLPISSSSLLSPRLRRTPRRSCARSSSSSPSSPSTRPCSRPICSATTSSCSPTRTRATSTSSTVARTAASVF